MRPEGVEHPLDDADKAEIAKVATPVTPEGVEHQGRQGNYLSATEAEFAAP